MEMNYNWMYSLEKYKIRKKKWYEKYIGNIDRIIEVFEKIDNIDFYTRTSEKELNCYIEEVEEKINEIEDKELVKILEPSLYHMKRKVKVKWRYKLIDILTKTRKEKEYTQNQLSKKTGISCLYIYRLENYQRHTISLEQLRLITEVLEVDINDLISEATKESEIKITNLPYEVKTIERLIKESFIINDNDKLLNSREKKKLIDYIKTI